MGGASYSRDEAGCGFGRLWPGVGVTSAEAPERPSEDQHRVRSVKRARDMECGHAR